MKETQGDELVVNMPAYHFQVTALNGASIEQNEVPNEGINEDVFDVVDTHLFD